ncbi:MAG: NADH:ubiquinone reductase (Na(+)-transporting) subunit B [Candidatus Desulfatibia sp.]|uniref:NADH:ubiquinone reductase (Na(+)-transporting) subunit B n=1 Tax=Candidatus Desulfatibia sp. TaxID=3101189 RepID=UPI002F340C6C
MKFFKRFFDAQRKHFSQGGRFARLYPFFESMETIFFAPADVTAGGPHVRDSLDVKRFMTLVIMALVPHLVFGIYNAGYQSHLASGLSLNFLPVFLKGVWIVLPLVIVTYAVGFFWEIVFAVVRRHHISEGLFVTCMLFPLTLPPTLPLWQAAVGISFGIVIGKEVFGGTGRNFLNPALTGRAFIFFAYPARMTGDAVWVVISPAKAAAVDAFSGATPLAISALAEKGVGVQAALSQAGYSISKLFVGLYPGSIGDTSTLLSLTGSVFLILLGLASYRIILGGVLGILSAGFVLNLFATQASLPWLALNPFYHLLMGGSAFGLAYMATDPVTAPDMPWSKWIYGFAIGVLTILIRVFNPAFVEGIMLAILFMNLFAPLLDHFEVKAVLSKRVPNV